MFGIIYDTGLQFLRSPMPVNVNKVCLFVVPNSERC